jgi:hypothetical protein
MKCLEKSPRRRYASALDLAEDLRRFQAGEPIRARPAGLVERVYRWCVRRPLAASLLALVGVLLAAFVVTVVVYEAKLQEALQQKISDEEAIAEARQRQIIRLEVRIGVTKQEAGDAFTALLYFTEALRLDDSLTEHDGRHRTRIAATLRQCPRLVRLLTFDKPIVRARLGPVGGWAATVGDDGAIEIWDLATGRPMAPPLPTDAAALVGARTIADDGVAPMPMSPDGGLEVRRDEAGGVRVWETATGRAVTPPLRHGGIVKAAAFSADGNQLVLVGGQGVVSTWELHPAPDAPEDRPTEELVALAQVLACASIDDNQERRPLDMAALKAAWERLPHGE